MGVYIPNMEMPKNCDECRIMAYEDTNCISVHELFCGCPIVFRAHPQHEEHRPDYCPLIKVQPHGRLIDADKLKEKSVEIQERLWNKINDADANIIMKDDVRFRLYEEMEDYIDDAPTIIEAEGEE